MFSKFYEMSLKSWGLFVAATAVLTLCLMILGFLFQGSRGIWQPDEGYYTGTAVTMLSKGSLFIPYLGEDEIFLDKPPMVYWGIIAGLKLFGHSEFGARFFHGLCFVLTSLAVGALGFSLFKNRWLALFSSLVYATMIIPFFAANFVTPDTILTLWTTLAALCFWNSFKSQGLKRVIWQMLLCGMVGLGFLAKGPAVFIPCGAMFIFIFIKREIWRYFFTPWAILGGMIFLVTGLSWYIWIGFKIPGALSYFFDCQVLGRLVTEKYNRNPGLTGALIYLPVLVFGSLPWSIIWLDKTRFKQTVLNKQWWNNLNSNPEILFLVSYFLVPLVILCLASSKLGLYVLPIFVVLAIATAKLWSQKVQKIENLSLRNLVKSFSRPIKLAICWICLLITVKLAIACYPTCNNMKTLWSQIEQHLPAENYEICVINKRADGLLFYGARTEFLTDKSDPYPTFTPTEHVLEEIEDVIQHKENGVFLAEDDNIDRVTQTLKKSGVEFYIVSLPYQRALLFPIYDSKNGKI